MLGRIMDCQARPGLGAGHPYTAVAFGTPRPPGGTPGEWDAFYLTTYNLELFTFLDFDLARYGKATGGTQYPEVAPRIVALNRPILLLGPRPEK